MCFLIRSLAVATCGEQKWERGNQLEARQSIIGDIGSKAAGGGDPVARPQGVVCVWCVCGGVGAVTR